MAYTGISMLVLWICLFLCHCWVFILEQGALLLYAHVW